jgi:hypothetical protein
MRDVPLAAGLIAASAMIVLSLGLLHLALTGLTSKFKPRDPELEARLKLVSPVISSQTTMWKAWVGFNASHSLGAILFGLVYGYLALRQPRLILRPGFLGVLGALFLLGYLFLAARFWFRTPLRGIALALFLYLLGFSVALVS